MNYRNLYYELEVIASEELAGPLERWERWTREDRDHLLSYLRCELDSSGMLSVEKARDAGQSLGVERKEARRLVARLEREQREEALS